MNFLLKSVFQLLFVSLRLWIIMIIQNYEYGLYKKCGGDAFQSDRDKIILTLMRNHKTYTVVLICINWPVRTILVQYVKSGLKHLITGGVCKLLVFLFAVISSISSFIGALESESY